MLDATIFVGFNGLQLKITLTFVILTMLFSLISALFMIFMVMVRTHYSNLVLSILLQRVYIVAYI